MSNPMGAVIQRYSLATLHRGRHANPSSVHISIDDNKSDNGAVDMSRDDGKTGEDENCDGERRMDNHGENREGHSLGVHTPAVTLAPALETIAECHNDDKDDNDIEKGHPGVSSNHTEPAPVHHITVDGANQLRSIFAQAREQYFIQQQQQQELERLQIQRQQQQELRQAIQDELARAEDKTSFVSDVTAGTLRSERQQAKSFLNLRMCDTQYL